MKIASLIARLLIAATFSVAGISKLLDLKGTRKGIQDFGVPSLAAGQLAIFLPLLELAVAGLLVPLSTVLRGSLGSVALLLVFIAAILVNLAQGRKPTCNCFGQIHSERVGWPTVMRNCIFVGVASFAS
jgi:uncharacterized membrane protein YphA (DoxX/SURF4 family)